MNSKPIDGYALLRRIIDNMISPSIKTDKAAINHLQTEAWEDVSSLIIRIGNAVGEILQERAVEQTATTDEQIRKQYVQQIREKLRIRWNSKSKNK